MDLKAIMNSGGMWFASSFMVIVLIIQAILFLWISFREAEKINMPRKMCIQGIRSAAITAVGPSLTPIIILVSLIAVLGAPTAWMRLNDIGAARTELAMSNLAANVYGVDLRSPAFDLQGFSYCLWGMALNNLGFIALAMLLTHKMGGMLDRLNEKADPRWIKYMLGGVAIALFSFLLSTNTVATKTIKAGNFYAAIASAIAFLVISRAVKKVRILQEPALGIAMFVGMLVAAALD